MKNNLSDAELKKRVIQSYQKQNDTYQVPAFSKVIGQAEEQCKTNSAHFFGGLSWPIAGSAIAFTLFIGFLSNIFFLNGQDNVMLDNEFYLSAGKELPTDFLINVDYGVVNVQYFQSTFDVDMIDFSNITESEI